MLRVGDNAPADALVWTTPRERATVGELAAAGPILLLFYLFDWSGT